MEEPPLKEDNPRPSDVLDGVAAIKPTEQSSRRANGRGRGKGKGRGRGRGRKAEECKDDSGEKDPNDVDTDGIRDSEEACPKRGRTGPKKSKEKANAKGSKTDKSDKSSKTDKDKHQQGKEKVAKKSKVGDKTTKPSDDADIPKKKPRKSSASAEASATVESTKSSSKGKSKKASKEEASSSCDPPPAASKRKAKTLEKPEGKGKGSKAKEKNTNKPAKELDPAEHKKRVSRKSSAYHKAKKEALRAGKTQEEAVVLAKEVL